MTQADDWDPVTSQYPPADITPVEFENLIVEIYKAASHGLSNLTVTPHERIDGVDGNYDFDATVRYRWSGLDFLVLVEAKRHRHAIKRDLVASLHSKLQGIGAQKAVLFATAPFQRGAIEFARTHGIALVYVTEGRHTFETRSSEPSPSLSREEAGSYGIPLVVGYALEATEDGGLTTKIVSSDAAEYLPATLLASSRPDRGH